jgi:tRNA 2-thiouridine synthesizing protein A
LARLRGRPGKRLRGETTMEFDKELDARGLSCPLPILKTKKSLNDLTSGQVLKVVATDPGSIKDMQAFATQTGNALLSSEEADKTYVFYLKKK